MMSDLQIVEGGIALNRENGISFNGRTVTGATDHQTWRKNVLYFSGRKIGGKPVGLMSAGRLVEFRAFTDKDCSRETFHSGTVSTLVNGVTSEGEPVVYGWVKDLSPEKQVMYAKALGENRFLEIEETSDLVTKLELIDPNSARRYVNPKSNFDLSCMPSMDGTTEYGRDPVANALLNNCAEINAGIINRTNISWRGYFWIDLERVPQGKVRSRPVVLGGGGYCGIEFVLANVDFVSVGRARGE